MSLLLDDSMEAWLKKQNFEEIDGIWYHFKHRGHTMVVFLEEDNSWTAHLSESINNWDDADNLLFSSLPEDQAKITITRLLKL